MGKGTSSWLEATILPAVPVDLLARGNGKLVWAKGEVGVAGGWFESEACSFADSNSLHLNSYALRAYPNQSVENSSCSCIMQPHALSYFGKLAY
jgi:hypothetical protein